LIIRKRRLFAIFLPLCSW